MVNKYIRVAWDKYFESDIDQVTIFLHDPKQHTIVDEFDVPENEGHMVFLARDGEDGPLAWVSIINPKALYNNPKATLPEISIIYNETEYHLREFLDALLENRII